MSREHLDTLTEIRSLMERSSKFLSLSGLSGVSAGVIALVGAGAVYQRLGTGWRALLTSDRALLLSAPARRELQNFLLTDAAIVLVLALSAGVFFTVRKARLQGLSVWNPASRRLLWALSLPLLAGGIFCLGLFWHGLIWLAFPATLVFYGLALLNASKYTVHELKWLGLCQIGLGLLTLFLTGYTLLTWALGFGLLHIVYGTLMWYKYDRPTSEKPNGAAEPPERFIKPRAGR